jgi:integrase
VTLARLLGHKDVNTTAAYYAVFSDRELADLQAKYSPLRRLLAEKRDGQLSSISLLEN